MLSVHALKLATFGSHTFAQPGPHSVQVVVLNRLATFTDPAGAEVVGDYTAQIAWGDGTTSAGTITFTGSPGSPTATFTVSGSHQYAEQGSYTITVTLSHDAAATATATSTAQVSDPGLVGTGGFTVSAIARSVSATQTVATFTDPGSAEAVSHYGATIDWGDNTTSGGTIQFAPSSAPLTLASSLAAGAGATSVVTGDLNGDGIPDLVANPIDQTISVFLGNGDGTFQAARISSLGVAPVAPVAPVALALADLNGDHKLDLIVVDGQGMIDVMLGNGDGTFQAATRYATGASPFAVAVADLRHTGTLDLLALSNQGVSVLLGNGDGTFGAAQAVALSGSNLSALAVGDLNGDGKPDLVVTDSRSSRVLVLLGNGDGTFGTATSYPVGSGPQGVALADLRHQGKLDLIVANSTGNSVSVLLGNGNGTFGAATNYPVGTSPVAVLAADINGDGNLDVVTANNGSNDVSVLLGNGDGTLRAATSLGVGTAPNSVAAATLAGGGRLDLVTASSSSNTLSVLLPAYAVLGSHRYAAQGTYTIHVTLNHDGVMTTAPTSTAQVGAPLPVTTTFTVPSTTPVYGQSVTVTATVTRSDGVVANAGTVTFLEGSTALSGALPVSSNGTVSFTLPPLPAGNQVITTMYSGSPDFDTSAGSITLMVTPAPLTITVNNATRSYGAANPTFSVGYSGFVNGDTAASLTTPPALSTTATTASHVAGGPYSITANGAVDPNYTITYVAGTLTITPVSLLITADSKTKPYGAAVPALTASYSGFVNGDTAASLTTMPTLSNTATAASHVAGSPYPITASGAVDSDYTISYGAGTLTVTPVGLTITADSKTKPYGASLPVLTASYSGFVNGDTAANLTTLPTLSTSVTAASHVSGSPYSITASGAADSDYTISYVAGTLSITPVPLTITADSKTKPYGAAVPALTASYSGFVNGDTAANLTTQPTLSTSVTAASHVSGSPYSITASGAADSDYTISYVGGTLTITAVPLTITANNATRIYGVPNPAFTVSYSGFVLADSPAVLGGTLSLSTPAVASSAPGTYAITPSGLTSSDYTIAFGPGTLTVTAAPLSATGQTITPTAGAPFSGVVARFTNADPFGGPGSYTAMITWGDGSTSAGMITDAGGGIYQVSGSHTYADPNNTTFTVTISHKLGYTTSATATGTASVANLGLGVQPGLTGGIGFWQSTHGQALINSFNDGSTSTALSAWLAASFPNLYGTSAGSHNLTGKTNAQVAAFYLNLFNLPLPKADAQVLAVALNIYATTNSLGGTAGTAYGFTVSATGLGARSYNVGQDGAAFSVANNTTLNVYQLLRAVNKKAVNGVLYNGDATLQGQAADLFGALNQAGPIG
jgi:hypothetical protein